MTQEELSLLTRYRQKRDAEAFRELVTLHKDMVYAACHRILGNAADAEDAAQNCFLAFARTPERIKKSVGGWLHRVAVGAAIDHLRQEKARKERESRAVQEQSSSESVEWDRVAPAIDEAINELPEDLRIPIIRYYLEGQKQEQIAQELNVTHSAVSKRLQRGTEALRGRLTKAGVALSVAALATLLSANAAEAAPVALTATLGKMALASLAAGGKPVAAGGLISMKVGIAVLFVSAAIATTVVVVQVGGGQSPSTDVADPPPAAQPAPSTASTLKVQLSEAVANRVVTGMRNMQLPYVEDEDLDALGKRFAACVMEFAPGNINDTESAALLHAIEQYIPNNFYRKDDDGYLSWPDYLRTLEWKIMLALKPRALTTEDLRKQEEQREWMRTFIYSIPEPVEILQARSLPPGALHEEAIARLEEKFADPFSVFSGLVLSDDGFAALKRRMEGQDCYDPRTIVIAMTFFAVQKRSASEPFPNDVAYGDVGENLACESNAGFRGRFYQVDDEGLVEGVPRRLLSLARQEEGSRLNSGIKINPQPGRAADLLEEHKGDFHFDRSRASLVGLRGARLLRLEVSDWMEADRIPTTELRERVEASGSEAVSVQEFVATPLFSPPPDPVFIALQNREGGIAVLRVERFTEVEGRLSMLWLYVRIRPDEWLPPAREVQTDTAAAPSQETAQFVFPTTASVKLTLPQIYSQRVALWAAALTDAGAGQVRQFSSPLVLKQGEEKWREQNLGGGFALQCDAESLIRFMHEGLNAQETAISETVYWFGEMRTPGHDQPSFEDIRYCRLLEGGWGGYNTKIAGEHVWGSFIMSGAYWMKVEETGIKIRLCFESPGSAVEHIDKLPLGTCWLFLLPTKPPGLPAGMSQGMPWHLYVIHAVGLTEAEEREIEEKMNILHRTGGQAFIELLNTSDHTTVQDQTDTQVP